MKTDVEKQEKVVTILYDLLRDHMKNEPNCTSTDLETNETIKVHLPSIGKALDNIMKNFGYERVNIQ